MLLPYVREHRGLRRVMRKATFRWGVILGDAVDEVGWVDVGILETMSACPHTTSGDYEIHHSGHGTARSRRDDGTRCTNLRVVFQGWFQKQV